MGLDINILFKKIMDNKAKLIFVVALLLTVTIGFLCYERYFIDRDYLVFAEAPCNPLEEVCFVYHCDVETEECSGIPEEDISYYKKVQKQAKSLPLCDPGEGSCIIDHCDERDISCFVTFCDPANPELECSSPEDFLSEELDEFDSDSLGVESELEEGAEELSE